MPPEALAAATRAPYAPQHRAHGRAKGLIYGHAMMHVSE